MGKFKISWKKEKIFFEKNLKKKSLPGGIYAIGGFLKRSFRKFIYWAIKKTPIKLVEKT